MTIQNHNPVPELPGPQRPVVARGIDDDGVVRTQKVDDSGATLAKDGLLTALGYEQFSTATLAASTALNVPATARYAWIQAEGEDLRMRADGVAPTSAVGMLISVNSDGWWANLSDLSGIRLIRTASGAIANVHYFK